MNEGRLKDAQRVAYLFAGYIRSTLTDAERDELDQWVEASDENMRLFVELTDEKNIEKGLKERGIYNADAALIKLRKRINEGQRSTVKLKFLIYGVAACVVLLIGAFILYKWTNSNTKPAIQMVQQKDLPPGGDKATLILADGQQVALDSTKRDIAELEDLKIVNDAGKLTYKGTATAVEYNTLTTPKGGQYRVVLADGTAVWLNAASSLKYPTAFLAKERVVELTGEGYFEVTKDTKPFKVKLNHDAVVEVLGTHFNINAYDDEQEIRTTLLEGSVKFSQLPTGRSVHIQAGQQAVLANDLGLTTNNDADLDEVTAWKNNMFEFHHQPIEAIMKQVARWYDVTVKYEGVPTDHFNATISRNVPASKLFYYLELTKRVHFTIQDKTITVKP